MSSEAGPAFPYTPLSGDECRFIRLARPEGDDTRIQCSMVQEPLGTSPFLALSYTWGDPLGTQPIHVNGRVMQVTENLAACLLELSQTSKISATEGTQILLWVDAICINQQDTAERSAQVLRMRHIYSAAAGTIAWLGKEKGNDHAAVAKLQEAWRYVAEHIDDLVQTDDREKHKQFKGFHNLITSEEDHGKGLLDFCLNDWWRRMWIVQEASLSGLNLAFFIGKQVLTFPQLWTTLLVTYAQLEDSVGDYFQARSSVFKNALSIMNLMNLKMDYHKGIKRPLLWLLNTTKDHDATDPRDNIYGLLGMSTDFAKGELVPDYGRSVNEVYIDLVDAHLSRYQSLHILNFCEPQRARRAGLPSWAPDWTRDDRNQGQSSEPPLQYEFKPYGASEQGPENGDTSMVAAYHASGDASFKAYPFQIDKGAGVLSLWGWSLGRVQTMSSIILPDGANIEAADVVTTARDLITWLRSSGMPDLYAATNESMDTVLKRTLMADFQLRRGGGQRGVGLIFPEDMAMNEEGAKDGLDATYMQRRTITAGETSSGRRLALTSNNLVGLVSGAVQVGDELTILAGGDLAYVLRHNGKSSSDPGRIKEEDRYLFLGAAYVHGMVDGEAALSQSSARLFHIV